VGYSVAEGDPAQHREDPTILGIYTKICTGSCIYPAAGLGETQWTYKRRIQNKMESSISESVKPPVMRIVSLWPTIKWPLVWRNVHMMPGTDTVRVQWYKTIHDVLPTNARLHRINLSPTAQCRHCTQEDNSQHRITECGEGPCIWQWTRQRIAAILRID
jgi:hypothetical protein